MAITPPTLPQIQNPTPAGQLPNAGSVLDPNQFYKNPAFASAMTGLLGQYQSGANQAQNTQLQNAGALANTQQSGANALANTGLQGQYGLANTAQQGQNTLAAQAQQGGIQGQLQTQALQEALAQTAMQTGAGVQEAQIASTPGLIGADIAAQKFSALFPYQKQLLSQLSPLLSNITGFLNPNGGPAANALNGGVGGYTNSSGGFNIPGGVNVPQNVISPGQAGALMGMNAGQGNAAALNQVNALRSQDIASGAGTGSPLEQQLANQLTTANRANLANANTSFLGALAPANAQQALGAGQLGALQQQNLSQEYLKRLGFGPQIFGGLMSAVTGLGGTAANAGGF